MPVEAAPIVLDPSGEFLGSDGAWSTFLISVGTPPQQLQVLASTEVASTWVVAPDGCTQAHAANCTAARGGDYDFTKSSSWNNKHLYGLGVEGNLGSRYSDNSVNGTYGYDTLEIQGKGANASVNHQVIASIITDTYYVGNLGLSPYPINFTLSSGAAPDTSPSLLSSLKNENLIPSLSYGYTAGAFSQQKSSVNGSLTLGGYDASRFTPNDISFTFAPTAQRQLVVGLQSITYSDSTTETPLLSDGVLALVDSTVPYLWLPETACTAFVDTFGLIWDGIHFIYLVNDSQHDLLLEKNPSVVLQLGNSQNGGSSINITLPYASFDLNASYPLVKEQSRYFPLQRAPDDDSVTLGRTFLQESFLIVDYEHSNFSISQAKFDPNVPSYIVPLASNASTATTGSANTNPTSSNGPIVKTTTGSSSHGIGTGAIAGIAIVIILIASLCGAFFIFKRRRNSKKVESEELEGEPKFIPDIDKDLKQDFSQDPETTKKPIAAATVTAVESPMTPPLSEADGGYFSRFNEKTQYLPNIMELPGSPGSPSNRSEMGSPELRELESPDPEALRSELSTPEPRLAWELPSPDPSHEMPASPGISSVSSGQTPPLIDNRRSGLNSSRQIPIQRPTSDRFDSSESDAGWTRDGIPRRPFHRRYDSSESLQSRPRNSRMGSSDSDGFIHSNRIDESTDTEAVVASAAQVVISPVRSRPGLINLDSSESEAAVSFVSSSSSSSSSSQQIPRRPVNTRTDSSSESEAPTPARATFRNVVGLTRPFHSSSSSRPAMRRSIHAVTRPFSHHRDSSDSDAWETRLDSASTENPSDVSRFPSVRHSLGASNAVIELRDGLLVEEMDERQERS